VNPADQKNLWLRSLFYKGMHARPSYVNSNASSPRSVEWIWSTNFAEWLESSESFYWITGLSGSGKSTLMKHIAGSKTTLNHLQRSGYVWTVIQFYFDFRAGDKLLNTLDGLLRTLLHELVKKVENVVEGVQLPDMKQIVSPYQCMDILCEAILATDNRICAFIDGLDEFQGPKSELIHMIHGLEDRCNMKICLASRPEPIFQEELLKYPHLAVQDHHDESIRQYTNTTWICKGIDVRSTLP